MKLSKCCQTSKQCLIAHYGTFRKLWDWYRDILMMLLITTPKTTFSIILSAILYVATIVPYNAAFFK